MRTKATHYNSQQNCVGVAMANVLKTEDEKEMLIELVRQRLVLYVKSKEDYKDSRTIKANNWSDIAGEIKAAHPSLQKRKGRRLEKKLNETRKLIVLLLLSPIYGEL